ncbi:MAG TPA: MMPL family transporter, partial [Thermomicrobiaceae bacterium]|nr:MMPL family transporter [Thermomicrobiaceae bacterium]
MFERLGHFTYRRRRLIAGLWALLFLATLPVVPHVPGVLALGGFSSPNIESERALAVLARQIPSYSPSSVIIIFQSSRLRVSDPAFVSQATAAIQDVVTMPEVTGVIPFTANPEQVAPDGHTAYTVVNLDQQPEVAQRLVAPMRARLRPTQLTVSMAGAPAFYADIERVTEQDLRRAEIVAIPFALAALILVFGSLVTAGVPVLVGGISVAGVLGAIFLLAHVVDLSIFVLNLATLLGLGLAIDYSLFLTSRFKEELARGVSVESAVAATVATAGRAVFFSGLTVLIGLSGLIVFDFMFLRSVGVAGTLVVAFALAGALTLLPATLGMLGHRVNALAVMRRGERTGAFWHWLADRVMAHPWRVILPVVAFIGLLGIPFTQVNLSSPDATILPRSTPSRQAFDLLASRFGAGAISPLVIAVQSSGPINAPQNVAALYRYTREIAADPSVWRIDSIVTVDPRLSLAQYQLLYADPARIGDPLVAPLYRQFAGSHATVIYVYTQALPGSNEAKQLLAHVRALPPGPGLTALVGGGTAEIVDVVNAMYAAFPIAIAIIVAATYLILLLQFRSLLLPLKAVVMNTLSIVASYGALVFIFQQGHFSRLLDFAPMGYVEASLPVVMFCLLFGVSMDYEV